jgi:DnaJ-class molecular chaperone
MSKDPYKILGLPNDATEEQIKKKYKKLALQFHPDKNPDPSSAEKFSEISEAYKALTSETDDEIFREFPELNIIFKMFGINNLNSLGSFAMQGFSNILKQKGQTIQTELELDLEDIFTGGLFDVSYKVHRQTGSMKQNVSHKQVGNMIFQETIMSPELEVSEEMTKVNVYPCYDPESGPIILQNIVTYKNDIKGDLLVYVKQKQHPIFTRKHNDLIITLNITLKEALTGFTRNIKHLNQTDLKINCKNIINPETEKIINNSGINENGSLIIKFNIEFPKELTQEQKNTLLVLL